MKPDTVPYFRVISFILYTELRARIDPLKALSNSCGRFELMLWLVSLLSRLHSTSVGFVEVRLKPN